MSRRHGAQGTWCVLACVMAAGCEETAGPTGTDVRYLPSNSLQPGELVRVSLESTSGGFTWRLAAAPSRPDYTLSPDGTSALFWALTPGDYLLHAAPADGAAGETRSAELRVVEQSCTSLAGTVVGVTGGESNRFVHVDPCTGVETALADLGSPRLTSFPQGIYAVDRDARRLYLPRNQDLEPRFLALNIDTGAIELDVALPPPGLRVVAVDPGGAGLFGVTDGEAPRLVQIDEATGALTDVAAFDGAGMVQGVYAVDPGEHRLYYVRGGGITGQDLVAVDTRSGAPAPGVRLASTFLSALQFETTSGRLFGITGCCPNLFVQVDRHTGDVTPVAILGGASLGPAQGLDAVAPDEHRFLFEKTNGTLVGLDTATGSQVSAATLEGPGLLLLDYVPAP